MAFYGCKSLTRFNVPKSVTSIGGSVIGGNNLSVITVDPQNTVYDSRENCNAIIETATNKIIAGCKNTAFPASVTEIGEDAFEGCEGMKSIEIPGTVKTIGFDAFRISSLNKVVIHDGVEKIDLQAFDSCIYLRKITIAKSVADIHSNAFIGTQNLTIYGFKDSEAEKLAKLRGYKFVRFGDVNDDESIDVLDAVMVQKYASGKTTLTEDQISAADVNFDGVADTLDAVQIQKFASGKISEFKMK